MKSLSNNKTTKCDKFEMGFWFKCEFAGNPKQFQVPLNVCVSSVQIKTMERKHVSLDEKQKKQLRNT